MQNPNQAFGQPQLNAQQLATLINLLAKSPQADPTSPQFNANFFSQLSSLAPQTSPILQPQPQIQPVAPKEPAFNYLAVKMVDDPKTIQPQEVTMGSRNLFPSSDGEKIFMKAWTTEGLIETETYVRQPKTRSSSRPKRSSAEQKADHDLTKRLSELELAIQKIQKQLASNANVSNEMAAPPQQNQNDADLYDADEYEEDSVNE